MLKYSFALTSYRSPPLSSDINGYGARNPSQLVHPVSTK